MHNARVGNNAASKQKEKDNQIMINVRRAIQLVLLFCLLGGLPTYIAAQDLTAKKCIEASKDGTWQSGIMENESINLPEFQGQLARLRENWKLQDESALVGAQILTTKITGKNEAEYTFIAFQLASGNSLFSIRRTQYFQVTIMESTNAMATKPAVLERMINVWKKPDGLWQTVNGIDPWSGTQDRRLAALMSWKDPYDQFKKVMKACYPSVEKNMSYQPASLSFAEMR